MPAGKSFRESLRGSRAQRNPSPVPFVFAANGHAVRGNRKGGGTDGIDVEPTATNKQEASRAQT
jgi:hypothetical protein